MSSSTVLAFDEIPRGSGGAGAAHEITRALSASGIDASADLYDEACTLARDGQLGPAAERLRMLLVLDPDDGDAALLLGKVLANGGRWQEALTYIDRAAAIGTYLPAGLRETVVTARQQEIADAEQQHERVNTRERTENQNLRNEARQLRSTNAALEIHVEDLSRRVRLWSSATALVAGGAAALLLASMLFGNSPAEENVAAVEAPETATETEAAPTAEVAPAPQAPEVTEAPAATTPVAAPPTQPTVTKAPAATTELLGVHRVRKGDTLGKISKRYYGTSANWPKIQAANRDILGDSVNLKLGTKLKIPALD